MIPFHNIDPIIFHIGPLAVRWYGLSYVIGVLFAWWYIPKIDRDHTLNPQLMSKLATSAIIGILVGGRLGYIVLYDTFSTASAFRVWEGGMSFHGGLIGLILGLLWINHHLRFNGLHLTDLLACSAGVGIFLGRIANFINGELFGKITSVPWGVEFPLGGGLPRHPSQLYEAVGEGLFLFLLTNYLYRYCKTPNGVVSGVFLIGYGVIRFALEVFRQPDPQVGLLGLGLSLGQWLSLPMIIAGGILITFVYKNQYLINIGSSKSNNRTS